MSVLKLKTGKWKERCEIFEDGYFFGEVEKISVTRVKFKDVVRVKFSPVNKLVRLNYKELCNWVSQLRLIDGNSCFAGYESMAVFKLPNADFEVKMERLPLARLVVLLNREVLDYVPVREQDYDIVWERDNEWLVCKNSIGEKIGRFKSYCPGYTLYQVFDKKAPHFDPLEFPRKEDFYVEKAKKSLLRLARKHRYWDV